MGIYDKKRYCVEYRPLVTIVGLLFETVDFGDEIEVSCSPSRRLFDAHFFSPKTPHWMVDDDYYYVDGL